MLVEGFAARYVHLDLISVNAGQIMQKGQSIGHSGNTDNSIDSHLHFEVRFNNERQNSLCWLDNDIDMVTSKVCTCRIGENPVTKKEEKSMERTKIEGKVLRCNSGTRPARC